MKYIIELPLQGIWSRSETYPDTYTAKRALEIVNSGYKKYGYCMTAVSPKTRLAIAKGYQREIAKLQKEREKLYKKALRELKVKDDNYAWDYLFNDQQGTSRFLEGLR